MKILVTGGAGYIGSFMVKRLLSDGYQVTVVDNLEKGHKNTIDSRASFIKADLKDKKALDDVFANDQFDGVIHFAGYISVEESTRHPKMYFDNNTKGSENLLYAMQKGKVDKIIFSSTAAVYGNPLTVPISEDHSRNPTNPYGESKLQVELLLDLWKRKHNLNFVSLRYFNASGAALDGSMGEGHVPETHIIPNAILSVIKRKSFSLFGTDYKTKDGTAIRDYIHVLDLVEAHVLALKKLIKEEGGFFYNVGTGMGFSNRQILDIVGQVSESSVQVDIKPRRLGDAEQLVADPTKIKKELEFLPKYSDIETIVSSAWKWHTKNAK